MKLIPKSICGEKLYFYITIFLGFSVCLYPYAISGFFFDDIFNSLLSGTTQYGNLTLREFIEQQLLQWFAVGRFFPVAIIIGTSIWDFCDSLIKYRIIHLSFIALNALLFFIFVRKISGSNRIAGLTILFLPIFFQFNPRWDGVTSFGPLNQLALLLVLVSWLSLIRYLHIKSCKYLWCSLGAEFLALATYEISVIVLPVQILLLLMYGDGRGRENKRAIIACLLIGLLYAIICLYLISNRGSAYEGINISYEPSVATFFYQFTSALPLSFTANKILPLSFNGGFFTGLVLFYILVYVKFLKTTSNLCTTKDDSIHIRHQNLLYLVSLIMAGCPPLLMAFSSRYQTIVSYGDPYIVVYIQYYGCALFFALLVEILFKRSGARRLIFALFFLFSLIAAWTVSVNTSRIKDQNFTFLKPRLDVQKATELGFMKQLNSGDLLVVDSSLPWESGDSCSPYFSMILRKKIQCISLSDLSESEMHKEKILPIEAGRRNIYIYSRAQTPTYGNELRLVAADGVSLIRPDNHGAKIKATFMEGGHGLIVGPILGSGFYGWEPSGQREWAWAIGDSTLIFYNFEPSIVKINFTFSIQSVSSQNLRIFINGEQSSLRAFNSSLTNDFNFALNLNSGRNIVEIRTDNKPIQLSKTDHRLFSFRIFNLEIN